MQPIQPSLFRAANNWTSLSAGWLRYLPKRLASVSYIWRTRAWNSAQVWIMLSLAHDITVPGSEGWKGKRFRRVHRPIHWTIASQYFAFPAHTFVKRGWTCAWSTGSSYPSAMPVQICATFTNALVSLVRIWTVITSLCCSMIYLQIH